MRVGSYTLAVILAVMMLDLAGSAARAQDACFDLWVERNSIYKNAGYCFKTRRAIRYFGNGGCIYDDQGDVPLSGRDRARVSRIIAEERALGCR